LTTGSSPSVNAAIAAIAEAAWTPIHYPDAFVDQDTGALAGAGHPKATTAIIRAHLINIPARLARSGRRLTIHLPQDWP
jgi:hypothetical protein